VPESFGFRRFLGGGARLTDLAEVVEKTDHVVEPSPPVARCSADNAGRVVTPPPTRAPKPLAPQKLPEMKKGDGSFSRTGRQPSYIWLSEKSREARSTAIDFYTHKF
jgi:hypothetical protein